MISHQRRLKSLLIIASPFQFVLFRVNQSGFPRGDEEASLSDIIKIKIKMKRIVFLVTSLLIMLQMQC